MKRHPNAVTKPVFIICLKDNTKEIQINILWEQMIQQIQTLNLPEDEQIFTSNNGC